MPLRICLLVPLLSCAHVAEEDWADFAARASCDTLRRCNPIGFHASYDTVEDCADHTQVGPLDASACTYHEEAARDCADALGWSCEQLGERYGEVVSLCDAVWTCD